MSNHEVSAVLAPQEIFSEEQQLDVAQQVDDIVDVEPDDMKHDIGHNNNHDTTKSASATAAADSQRTNSSSISSGGMNVTGSNVTFGSVHVHVE
jgi:hypothetical protein